ncbi:uncharacterized protein BJ212DRAFT_1371940 [Suillus subaureus]|uniref:Uncharacterized protein n=1 Tax=Suillus subaureus TaxID=48587 RepID=A0A9P7E6I5_9AGAM|nr:uncharacterized protein BJ212DRAFT_1371940 [Suillus subaureus]KAG1812175.1 hypothetical protein BJ212DRAFT_1371940 [Suillus subaureus]
MMNPVRTPLLSHQPGIVRTSCQRSACSGAITYHINRMRIPRIPILIVSVCPNIVYINTPIWFNLTSNMLTLSHFAVALALASSILGVIIPVVPSRRSGELWEGLEHEEVDIGNLAPSRRSGELWLGAEHEEIDVAGPALTPI